MDSGLIVGSFDSDQPLDCVSSVLGDVSEDYTNDEMAVLSPSLNRSQLLDARYKPLLSNVTWITYGVIPFTLDTKDYGPHFSLLTIQPEYT